MEDLLLESSSNSTDREITWTLEENEKDVATEEENKVDSSDIQKAKIMRALGNPDVMEHLAF